MCASSRAAGRDVVNERIYERAMCRFVLYLGEPLMLDALTTKPAHSLIRQSYLARERAEPLNGDGFGVAWYVPTISDEPAVFRATTPAWNNPNLTDLARVTQSSCILAHVRAATPPSPVTELNCHPFKHKSLALMHNGFIPGFKMLRRTILRELSNEAFDLIRGSTDSEHLLAMFFDHWSASETNGVERLAGALLRTIADVDALCHAHGIEDEPRLNIAVTDGNHAVASRYCLDPALVDSLYVHRGKAYVCEEGLSRMVETDEPAPAVIVASEPLSEDPGWTMVPPNHIVLIDALRQVEVRPARAI